MIETNKVYKMEAIELLKQLPDNSVDLVLTDPPYNMTACEWDKPIDFQELWKELKRVGKENCAFVFTASQPFTTDLINSNREMFKYELIWNKLRISNPMLAKKRPLKQHENIIVFYNKQSIYNPQPYKKNTKGNFGNQVENHNSECYGSTNIFKNKGNENEFGYPRSIVTIRGLINFGNEKQEHPTQKPTSLFEWLIKSYSNENQLVLDCFAGSGTTAVVSKKLNRNFICCDINEEYVKIANSRLSETAPVVTLASPTFPTENIIGIKRVSAETPNLLTQTSLNSDIK